MASLLDASDLAVTGPPPDRDAMLRELGRWFRPEFLNRIDRIVHFNPLSLEVAERIARREIEIAGIELTSARHPCAGHCERRRPVAQRELHARRRADHRETSRRDQVRPRPKPDSAERRDAGEFAIDVLRAGPRWTWHPSSAQRPVSRSLFFANR